MSRRKRSHGAINASPGRGPADQRPHIYVHLDHGRSPHAWTSKFTAGQVLEDNPYGYRWTDAHVDLRYSEDRAESPARRLARRGTSFILGFDIVHAWRNRTAMRHADVIWTHSEHEHLAVALLINTGLVPTAPLLAQSVWLWDQWPNATPWRRALLRWLLGAATLHTTLSPVNAAFAATVLNTDVTAVPFGIEPAFTVPPKISAGRRVKVLAPGNDRHRDWALLREVARANPDLDVLVLSRRRRARRLVRRDVPNFVVRPAAGTADLVDRFDWADVVAIPLGDNSHASGITVALEATFAGRPVAITDVGGVRSYLEDGAAYAERGSADSMALAIHSAAGRVTDQDWLDRRRQQAQDRGLTARDFGLRHVLLTRAALSPVPEEREAWLRRAAAYVQPVVDADGG